MLTKKKLLIVILMVFSLLGTNQLTFAQAPCAFPPCSGGLPVLPNVLIDFDISGSMLAAAYVDSDWEYGDEWYCHEYDINGNYQGLFDPDKRYNYNSSVKYFEQADGGDWSGNFLNWVTMLRIDIARYILTGGRIKESGGNRYLVSNEDSREHYTRKKYTETGDNQTPYKDKEGSTGYNKYRVYGDNGYYCNRFWVNFGEGG